MHTNPITIPLVQYNAQHQEHKHGVPLLKQNCSVLCVISKLDVTDQQE